MKLLNVARKASMIRFYAGLIVVGLLFCIVSGVIFFQPKNEDLVPVTATITDVCAEADDFDNVTNYILVTYEAEGKTYENVRVDQYSSGMAKGDTVELVYDPKDPSNVQSPRSDLLILVIFAVGALALVIGIVKLISAIRKPAQALEDHDRVTAETAPAEKVEEVRNDNEPTSLYYFHFDKHFPKQGHVMEDKNREVVYEGILKKMSLAAPNTYEFVNHVTGRSRTLLISHVLTKTMGAGRDFSFRVPISSSFKVDGVDIWDYLEQRGFGFSFQMNGIRPAFDIKHYGVVVGHIENTGTDVYMEKAENNPLYKLPAPGNYQVQCKKSDLDDVFMICYAITKALPLTNND